MWKRAEGTLRLCRQLCRKPFFWRGGTADAFEGALAEADEAATEPEYRLQGLLIYDVRLLIALGKEANRGVFCRFSLLLWTAKE